MKSWITSLPSPLNEDHSETITDMFEWLVDPCMNFVRKNCKVCLVYAFQLSSESFEGIAAKQNFTAVYGCDVNDTQSK